MSPVQHELYEMARHAGRSAGRTDIVTAALLRDSVIDATSPAQLAGWLDGLAETRPEPVEWPLVARAGSEVAS
jgi:hypothetical protein